MGKKQRLFGVLAICLMIFGGILFLGRNVSATGAADNLYKRAYANNLKLCYNESTLKPSTSLNIKVGGTEFNPNNNPDYSWNYKESILEEGLGKGTYFLLGSSSDKAFLSAGCGALFDKDKMVQNFNGNQGHTIFEEFGKTVPTTLRGASTFLTDFGYNFKEDSEKTTYQSCLSVTEGRIGTTGTASSEEYYICYANSQVIGQSSASSANYPDSFYFTVTRLSEEDVEAYGFSRDAVAAFSIISKEHEGSTYKGSCSFGLTVNPQDLLKYDTFCEDRDAGVKYIIKGFSKEENTNIAGDYKISNYDTAYKKARQWLTGEAELQPFSIADIINLYMDYLKDYGAKPLESTCQATKPENIASGNGYYVYAGEKGWCNLEINNEATSKYYTGFGRLDGSRGSDDKKYFPNKVMSFEELLNELAYWAQMDPEAAATATGNLTKTDESTKDGSNKPKDLCYDSAGSMGWILCPAVAATAGVGNGMWSIIEQQLQIDPDDFADKAVQSGWEAMRNIANTVFIILFMVVIFSQLTGVGIDNYGIKKILPKLIIIAILINLSFVICQVFVDLSNILGVGLKNLLGDVNIAQTAEKAATEAAKVQDLVGGVTGLTLAGVSLVAIFTKLNSTGLKGFGASVGIAALGIVVVVLVAVLTIFLILFVRQAGVILLMVLSPLAIVCYALPNTEKLFKKWVDAFKALLIVYPICGAAIGAGEFARKVLAGSSPIVASVISVVPYFFVPILLKNSLNAIGNIGGKISAIGRSLGKKGSGAATGAIKENDRFKDWSNLQKRTATLRRTQRRIDALSGQGDLSDAQRAALAQAERRRAAALGESEKDYETIYKNKDRSEVMDEVRRGLEGGDDVALIGASLDSALDKGGEGDVMEAIRDTDFNSLSKDAQRRALQSMINSKSEVLQGFAKYRQTGGAGNFEQWMAGGVAADAGNANIKSRSLASHLDERGIGAMNNLSRDALKFLRENDNGWSSQLGDKYNKMIASAAINSTDARAKTEAETMMRDSLAKGANIDEFGLTASALGSMRGETMQAILDGYNKQNISSTHANLTPAQVEQNAQLSLRAALNEQITAAKGDAMIMNKMNGDVKKALGL